MHQPTKNPATAFKRVWWIGALALATTAVAIEVPKDLEARVDAFVRAGMEQRKIPGVAAAVVMGGEVLLAKGYGQANVEHAVPVDRATIFQSGSLGKQFTAALMMLLVEEGKVGLGDSLTQHFPAAPETWRAITVRHLLTHTSGIPDYDVAVNVDLRHDYTDDELTKLAFGLKLEFPPGARWNYSNTGYVLLGILMNRVTGKFYGDLLRDRICRPAGMKTMRIINEADIVPHRAAGYRLVGGALKNQEWVAPLLNTTADGAMYFSLDDLIAWDRAWRERRLLKAESWAQMLTPVRLNSGRSYPYGFGISLEDKDGQRIERHAGAWQGFRTSRTRYVGDDFSVLVLANLANADTERLADGIAAIVNPALAVPAHTPLAEQPTELAARLRRLLTEAAAGTLSPAELTYVRADFFSTTAKQFAKMLSPLGPPGAAVVHAKREMGDDTVYEFDVAYAKKTMGVRLGVAADNMISVFQLRPNGG